MRKCQKLLAVGIVCIALICLVVFGCNMLYSKQKHCADCGKRSLGTLYDPKALTSLELSRQKPKSVSQSQGTKPAYETVQVQQNSTFQTKALIQQKSDKRDQFNIRTYSEIMSNCKSECVDKGGTQIPRSVFFVKTDSNWMYTEWVAVLSAYKNIKPDVIYIVAWMEMEPNCWWNRTLAIPGVTYVIADKSKWVTEIRGKKFVEAAHVCDYMKITVLHEMGGILMDTDAIAIKSFDPLLTHQAVLARDQGGFVVNGLMISQKHSCYMCNFAVSSYRRYNGNWNTHSTWTLNPVSRAYSDVLILKQYEGFFPFSPNEIRLQNFLLKDKANLPDDVSHLYAVHLYHNLLNKNEVFRKIKEQSIDMYSWLRESKSFGAEVFRSIIPPDFQEEHFDTSLTCKPLNYSY